MDNINTIDNDELFDLIKRTSNLSMSYQLFACFDILRVFKYLAKFEAKDVKYELLTVYSESVIERSLKLLLEKGLIIRESRQYSVVQHVLNN